MILTQGSLPIDLRTWQLFAYDGGQKLNEIVMQEVTDILREAFERDPPYLHFPFMWGFGEHASDGCGGPPVSDPVMLYVSLPLSADGDEPCHYACSLEGAVDGLIDSQVNPQTGKIDDPEGKEICARIAGRLTELAGKLDAACQSDAAEVQKMPSSCPPAGLPVRKVKTVA